MFSSPVPHRPVASNSPVYKKRRKVRTPTMSTPVKCTGRDDDDDDFVLNRVSFFRTPVRSDTVSKSRINTLSTSPRPPPSNTNPFFGDQAMSTGTRKQQGRHPCPEQGDNPSPIVPDMFDSPQSAIMDSPDVLLSRRMERKCSIVPSPPPPPFKHTGEQAEEELYGEISRFDYEFEVLGVLGSGTFGTVHKCKKRLDGCLYAVKVTKQQFRGHADRERVLKEVYALAALCNNNDNPHIVRYFSAWVEDGRLFIQTELCDMSLQDMLEKYWAGEQLVNQYATPELFLVDMLRQMLLGLSRLHGQNLVHLDIKPANIFVKNGTYKLGDLGHASIARISSSTAGDTGTSSFSMDTEVHEPMSDAMAMFMNQIDEGDSRYMALELLKEEYGNLTKADIFSLGASVYEILLGRQLPGNGPEWEDIRDGKFNPQAMDKVSKPMQQLIGLMLHPDPKRRPSAQTLLASGGPNGLLRTDFENELAREKKAANEYRKELAKLKRGGPLQIRRVNTL